MGTKVKQFFSGLQTFGLVKGITYSPLWVYNDSQNSPSVCICRIRSWVSRHKRGGGGIHIGTLSSTPLSCPSVCQLVETWRQQSPHLLVASKIHKSQLKLKWNDPGWTKQSLREEKHQPGKEDCISNQDLENALFNT